jgi:hypothetical protein
MDADDDKQSSKDEIPRQSILANIPKRTFSRVLLLLLALGGIIYLRERTSSIAGCMSNSFRDLPSQPESAPRTVRAHIAPPLDGSAKPSR